MNRQQFVKQGLYGLGALLSSGSLLQACTKLADPTSTSTSGLSADGCTLSPSETKGPFPIKSPAELVKSSIVSDREGIPLVINVQVVNQNKNCAPVANAKVDLWHCDADGNYSEYGGTGMQQTDYTNAHFLRGRQTTDTNGQVSFISIYPGWYRGRASHIHLEVIDANGSSLVVSQIAFPEDTSSTVYATEHYNGEADTSNTRDNIFSDSLVLNMADSLTGNTTDGYVLTKTITVNA